MNTKFCSAENTRDWFDWCHSLLDLYTTDKQFMYKESLHRVSYKSLQKWILAHDHQGTNRLLRTLLLDAMISADKTPGSGVYVPYFLYNEVDENSKRYSANSYKDMTLSLTKNRAAAELFDKLFHLAGPLTKIMIKPSPESGVIIRDRDSFMFPLHLDPQFHRMIGHVETIEINNPTVIMIEGAPETISEIDSLLRKNYESKRPIMLIARNFPEEISATLATNWIKNSLSVLPFVYGDSLSTINLAADMCAVTKSELISPHFGDVISIGVLDEDKYGSIDRCIWSHRGVSLYKNVDVSVHLRKLASRAKNADNDELREIINERILSLSNDALEVWLPQTDLNLLEELDSLIKHYGGFVTSGATETPLGFLPTSFVVAGQSSAQTLRKEILNIGGFLVRANDEMVAG